MLKQTKSLLNIVANHKIAFGIIVTLPILAFFYLYLSTGSKLVTGDFDYLAQAYQAFRISVLHYHQFPWWNPWMSGGVPLFANPQFGLFSVQSLFVLFFGAVYGLKLAYIVYAIAGFWGMYIVSRRTFGADRIRAILVSYVWVFNGFFTGHNISQYTFSLFFLLPWLFYFVVNRQKKYSWLWLGLLFGLITLSSVHYSFLMMTFVIALVFLLTLMNAWVGKSTFNVSIKITKKEVLFVIKTAAVFLLIAGYRLVVTYLYLASNPKAPGSLNEGANHPTIILKALFLPIDTIMKIPSGLPWGWAEYSAYMGMGVTAIVVLCIFATIISLVRHKKLPDLFNSKYAVYLIIIGLIALGISLGNFSKLAPFHLLRQLPGFAETRVASRWLVFPMFSTLLLIAAWTKQRIVINILLAFSVLELFLSYGPTNTNYVYISVKQPVFSSNFTQYDNGYQHLDAGNNHMHFYYVTTSSNIGQIYADDSVVNTLDKVYKTSRCAENVDSACRFVLSNNASVALWSPNKIILNRTGPGQIELNMNTSNGWRVNGSRVFAHRKSIFPQDRFIIDSRLNRIVIVYSPVI